MAQYIYKDALVTEIDKRLHQLTDAAFDSMIGRNLIEIKDFLDTLEVKEVQEEPVSEELEKVARKYASIPEDSPHDLKYCVQDKKAKYDAVLYGANWQKQQMESNRIEHCNSITNEQAELEQGFIDHHLDKYNRMPTYLDAIEYGMRVQKEQMMKEAVDGSIEFVTRDGMCKPTILYEPNPNKKLQLGENVKIIILKE